MVNTSSSGMLSQVDTPLLQYTTKNGIRIQKADLPRGKHKLKVTIGDNKGGITEEIFIVKLL